MIVPGRFSRSSCGLQPGNEALGEMKAVDGGLSVRIRRRVHATLELDVAFRLGPEVGVIFGASGAGKTSLLRLISGLAEPDSGRIELDGTVVHDTSARVNVPLRLREIGMIFQHDLLFPHLRVRDNIGFGLKRRRWAGAASQRIQDVANLVGVEHLLDRWPETLSGGERQRVGLARSLAPRPRLLLCDEPVSALDLTNRHALIDRLKAVQRAEKIPILYVTHSPAEAISLGDVLFLLDGGRIAARGTPIEILGTLPNAGSADWDGVRNVFPATVERSPDAIGDQATLLRLQNGPLLHVPSVGLTSGSRAIVEIPASDIILADGPVQGLSAQNILPGVVEKVIKHGAEAEVLVRTMEVAWIVSVVASTLERLEIAPGRSVSLIVKARSCRVRT